MYRITIVLGTMACFSSVLAIISQDRALTRDLESAAVVRLERSVRAGQRVVEEHLTAVGDRYRAISRTPQLRATFELNDPPTLRYLAGQLAQRNGATAVAFIDPSGETIASVGNEALLMSAPRSPGEGLRSSRDTGGLFSATRVALETSGRPVGSLVVFEGIEQERIDAWSELCGASLDVEFDSADEARNEDVLVREVLALNEGMLVARSSLDPERAAAAHARSELIRSGVAALGLSFLACLLLARSLVRPIKEIQNAIERIRKGELATQLDSLRGDEIGDVARGVDRMAVDLLSSRTELDLRIEELDRNRTHLANAQQLARIGSFEIDLQSGELAVSQELYSLLGRDSDDGVEKIDIEALVAHIHAEDRKAVVETVTDCIETGVSARLDHRIVVDGLERVIHTQLQLVSGCESRSAKLEGTAQDVTERRRAEDQIQFLAHHDGLTGLGNRLHFKQRLELAITQSHRKRTGFGIFFLDLDHFKRINDTLGHSVGDEVLKLVADRIVTSLRDRDEVSRGPDRNDGVLVSRLGGDEFTLMLPDVRDPKELASVAQRILDSLDRPLEISGHEIVIGASIGIAVWPQDGHDIDTLLRNADAAMYEAKADGRNLYRYYEQSMNEAAAHRLEIESRLRRAIENDGIDLHYQPRIHLSTGKTVGFEALARWRDPELGQISPAEFIPIAEQTGMIVAMTRNSIRKVCKIARQWDSGPQAFSGRISVNVSARHFKLSDVARDLFEIIAETGVNPLRLEIEVTESVVLQDEERVLETLRSIREMGVAIAMDDFGTGYSSLSYLRKLPIDVLKIDIVFVREIVRNEGDRALARAIVAMGDALGMKVVAEGVEHIGQRDLLREWGCDEMQGFLASPAISGEDAHEWLRLN